MKGFETYLAIMVVAGIVVAAIFLLGVSGTLTGKESITASMAGELAKAGSGGCGSDADCKGSGVCTSAKCVCFDNSQCKISCDKSVGKCTFQSSACIDSDNGLKPEVQGKCMDGSGGKCDASKGGCSDECTSQNAVIEYYCEGYTALLQSCKSQQVSCASGKVCKNGVCI